MQRKDVIVHHQDFNKHDITLSYVMGFFGKRKGVVLLYPTARCDQLVFVMVTNLASEEVSHWKTDQNSSAVFSRYLPEMTECFQEAMKWCEENTVKLPFGDYELSRTQYKGTPSGLHAL